MEINRISGGIEYRPEMITLVLPGDRDYRVRSPRTSGLVDVSPERTNTPTVIDGSYYSRVEMASESTTLASQSGLALLKRLGEMEAEGTTLEYPGMDVRDEYAGGYYGIIDIRV